MSIVPVSSATAENPSIPLRTLVSECPYNTLPIYNAHLAFYSRWYYAECLPLLFIDTSQA
jgi:hypothetical protein